MNILLKTILTAIPILASSITVSAERLVIMHTNDTHSQIDPDSRDNLGGVVRRMALIDSIRAAEPNALLIDAGDAVQGTLYFNLYGGKVEQEIMNIMDYDMRILGNHEFDNGVDSLYVMLKNADTKWLATNYDLRETPLGDMFESYEIYEYDDRRIGFMAINLEPKGMISEGNYDGVEYLDAIEASNSMAWYLRNVEHCDIVVAITHIGYNPLTPPGDVLLAKSSRNIDVIIGGHSHEMVSPTIEDKPALITNLDGKDVILAQVYKQGKNLGLLTIDLDNLGISHNVIPVNSRLDNEHSENIDRINETLAPYRAGIDSLMTRTPVGRTRAELTQNSPALLNWLSDLVLQRGRQMAENVDLAILNKGGIRRGLPKGTINEGEILTMLPFNNYVQVIDIKGSDLLEAFAVMAVADGNGVSEGVDITYIPGTEEAHYNDARVVSATLNGQTINPEATYRVATLDYLANGGDYMLPLMRHELVAASDRVFNKDVLDYLRTEGHNKKINPSAQIRMHK